MTATELFHQDGKSAGIWFCTECRRVARLQKEAENCCRPKMCDCGKEVEEQYYTVCRTCRTAKREADERARFEAAEKVTDWTGPVYREGCGWNDGYAENLSEMLEMIDDSDDPRPEYVYCCHVHDTVYLDGESILISASEDNAHEEFEISDLNGVDEFYKACDTFNALNSGTRQNQTWRPDEKRVILIPAREEEE